MDKRLYWNVILFLSIFLFIIRRWHNIIDADKKEQEVDKANDSGEEESSDESIPDAGALDDDDDSDFDPNDDPEKLWCFCKKPHANRLVPLSAISSLIYKNCLLVIVPNRLLSEI